MSTCAQLTPARVEDLTFSVQVYYLQTAGRRVRIEPHMSKDLLRRLKQKARELHPNSFILGNCSIVSCLTALREKPTYAKGETATYAHKPTQAHAPTRAYTPNQDGLLKGENLSFDQTDKNIVKIHLKQTEPNKTSLAPPNKLSLQSPSFCSSTHSLRETVTHKPVRWQV